MRDKSLPNFLFVCLTVTLGLLAGLAQGQTLDDPKIGLKVDEDKLRANRIRKISSDHLTLFTDLPEEKEVDELGKVFDEAVKQWRTYFGLSGFNRFHATGFLIKDKSRFIRAGVIPASLPEFKNGYTYGFKTFWMYDQPSHYMRRQLMLHEGTHAFLFSTHSGDIAAWYNEGMAEWFAAHKWSEGKLTTGLTIADRDDAPYWGRTKVIRDAMEKDSALTFSEIRNLPGSAFLRVDPYGWVWAATTFMNSHPEYKERFRKLPRSITSKGIDKSFEELFASDMARIEEQWAAFLHDLDYGVDGLSARIQYDEAKVERGTLRSLAADKSWQNSGIKVTAGKNYLIRSKGRFVIRESLINGKQTAWPCETNGVTIEYYRGQPLGKLMAVVKPDKAGSRIDFEKQIPVGLSHTLKSPVSGTLFFRVNETPAGLSDNSGSLLISVVEK